MSDADDATTEEPADGSEEEESEQPEIEDEEMADFGAVADEIEEAAGASATDDEDADGDDSTDSAAAEGDDGEPDLSMDDNGEDRITPGDIYCNALGMSAAVARASYGSADPDDRSDLVEEYGEMARDLQIDEYVDQWLEEHGGMDELSPGQAILLSTVMFGGMVAMDDPEILDNVAAQGGEEA